MLPFQLIGTHELNLKPKAIIKKISTSIELIQLHVQLFINLSHDHQEIRFFTCNFM